MNLTHKILEGIHDVEDEFEINPELLKNQGKNPEHTLKLLTSRMSDVGWNLKKSISGSGTPYHVEVLYSHHNLNELVDVAIGNDGKIKKAMFGNYKSGIYPIEPNMDAVIERAKAAVTWVAGAS